MTDDEAQNGKDMAALVAEYVETRDVIKLVEDRNKSKLSPLKEKLDKLEGELHAFLDQHNLDNLKTKSGTVHRTTKFTATVADADVFMKFIIDNQAFDLLERRAKSEAVKEFVEKTKHLPPGCNSNLVHKIGVRRAPGS